MLRQDVRVLCVLAALLVVYTGSVSACSCMPPGPPEQERNRSDAVFAGAVETIQNSTTSEFMGPGQDVTVTFDVSQVWKGQESETVAVKTATSSASCGYAFQEGESYLVYAEEDEGGEAYHGEDGELTVSLCSRTAPLEDAEQDINALGAASSVDTDAQDSAGSVKHPGGNTTATDKSIPGFGEGFFLALTVPPLLALISLSIVILLAMGRTGRLLKISGILGTLSGVLGIYTVISNPNTMVLLTEDPLFSIAMIAPFLLGITALICWYTG